MPRITSKSNNKSYTPLPPPPMRVPAPLQNYPPSMKTPSIPLQNQPPSMLDSIKQGFSFGVGSSIAHNMVNSIFGSKNKDENINKKEVSDETKLTTDKIYEIYNKCLEKNDNNVDCTVILQNISNK
jgi:hypothetical protein